MKKISLKSLLLLLPIVCTSILQSTSLDTVYLRKMKDQNGALSLQVLQQIKTLFGVTAFIESGTYLGDTAEVASRIFEVHTVELSQQLFTQAQKRFIRNRNVHLYFGDSSEVLPKILPTLQTKKLLFWLDGHWSAGNTAKGALNTPIIQELQLIQRLGIKDSVILIDDIRFFQKPVIDPHGTTVEGYPELKYLIDEIKKIDASYQYLVLGDILLAFPGNYQINASPLVRACTISRLFDGTNYPISEVLAAEAIIAEAQGEELETIQWLSSDKFTFNSEGEFGQGRYYFLWNALTLSKRNPERAVQFFNKAIINGCDHERVYLYKKLVSKELK